MICGEWCLFNSYACGCDTKGGRSVLNGEEGSQKEALGVQEKKQIYQAVAEAQLNAWKKEADIFTGATSFLQIR